MSRRNTFAKAKDVLALFSFHWKLAVLYNTLRKALSAALPVRERQNLSKESISPSASLELYVQFFISRMG